MIPLLHSTTQYNVIAIQEPWLNPHMQATYCPTNCPYTVIFSPSGQARTCFLINKAIPVSMWSHKENQLTSDYCQITLQLPTGPSLTIHNIYSPIPPTADAAEWGSPTPNMLRNIQHSVKDHEYLVVGDFNLHHPIGEETKWPGYAVAQPTSWKQYVGWGAVVASNV